MGRKFLTVTVLVLASVLAYGLMYWRDTSLTEKIFSSALWVVGLYTLFALAIEETVSRRLHDSKTRYTLRKAVWFMLVVVILIVLLRIWIPDPQALLVAYGVVAAGIAVALQDVVKNLAGSATILFGRLFSVGNRIEIDGTHGDVIDIGLFSTKLLEIRGWITADQASGRIVSVPNGAVLNKPVYNYTKHHKYLWDELRVVVTAESDWSEAMRLLGEIGHEHTQEFVDDANQSLTRLERYYYVEGHILDPNVYVQPAQDGYELTLRYVVDAWKRRSTNSNIWGHVVRVFDETPAIKIAPTTIANIDYPEVVR